MIFSTGQHYTMAERVDGTFEYVYGECSDLPGLGGGSQPNAVVGSGGGPVTSDGYGLEVERDAQGGPARLHFIRWPQSHGERVLRDEAAIPERVCPHCREPFRPARPHQVYCTDAHRLAAWKARQASLPLTPEPIRVAVPPHNPKLVSKLKPAALHVLGLLGDGLPHSRHELARVGGARYSARVAELRDAGHRILGPSKSPRHEIYETEPAGPGRLEMYRLAAEGVTP